MTDNIKAKGDELIKKFVDKFRESDTCFGDCENSVSCQHSWYSCESWLKYATESAIIAVEEIIKVADSDYSYSVNTLEGEKFVNQIEYWNSVLNYLKSKQ